MSLGKRIKQARTEAGLTQQQLADALKKALKTSISRSAIAQWESDDSAPTADKIEAISSILQQPGEWLLSNKGPKNTALTQTAPRTPTSTSANSAKHAVLAPDVRVSLRQIPVIGFVQAGVWLATVELPEVDRFDIPLPIQAGFDGFVVQGLIVRGPSMDQLYPHGSVLAVVSYQDLGREPRTGERVVALRFKHGETEATVKEFQIGKDGKARLWPRSHHPDFQAPVLVEPPAGDDEEVLVAYLVIGSYRPEI